MKTDYYQILGLATTADAGAIKKAFRQLAMRLHPDVNPAPGATEKFMQVNEAYEILSDPRKKDIYDRSRLPRQAAQGGRAYPESKEYNDWVAQAQRRAQAYSRMNYEQFEKTRFDLAQERFYFYLQFILVGMMYLMVTFFMTFPVMLFVVADWRAIFLCAATVPLSLRLFQVANVALAELRTKS